MHQVFATPAAEPASAWSVSELALLPFKRGNNQAPWSEKDEPGSLLIGVEVSQARLIDSANPAFWIAPILLIAALGGWLTAQGRRQRLKQQALEAAKQEAEAANRAKSQFLANMSHEMRTPLNALLGYGHLLEMVPLEDEHREQVHKLNQAGQALLALVDDVLDIAKIEAGEFHLAHEPPDLSANLDQVRRLMAVIAAPKGLDLVVAPLPAGLPRHYLADPPRLRQILVNLVGNALKFTPRGQVRLSVQALPGDDPTHQWLRFEVSDTGIGISAADQARLFTRFQQLQDDNRRCFGGTGLGLAIVNWMRPWNVWISRPPWQCWSGNPD